jgi:asparagine synthase (glutamine-hydrolysing)
LGFHGKFLEYPGYDESRFARAAAASCGIELQEVALTHRDFEDTIETVLYHLDFPTAGPGSFPQYHVSKLAARSVKVILGGQGGDEIFGGYARYLVGYIEHALKAEIERSEGSAPSQDLRLSQIADGLDQLSVYKPMMRKQFAAGMFEPLDQRFLRLIDRTGDFGAEVNAEVIDANHVRETYAQAFTPAGNARANALDQMTRFDFKYLLPALLQVEDRVSMAHGLESRVPFVDRDVVALAATAPMAIKYPQGQLKGWLRSAFDADLPPAVRARRDKLGFPTPFPEWMGAESAPWLHDVFSTQKALNRDIYDARAIIASAKNEPAFARKLWGLLCLELWQRQFLDKDWRFEG